jgi:YidC/Oxa1 family membrane protein insertase
MNFDFLFDAFGSVLAALYDLRPSYAFMIIGLTLIVMVVVTPLTLKATRSMLMMQQLQPELKKLQSKYKDDRQQLNEEMLKFYRENNINPVGGCLPLLVQTPVFLVLYSVLRGLTLRVPTMGSNVGNVVAQHLTDASVIVKPPQVIHPFDPMYLPETSELYNSLHGTTEMLTWFGVDLSRSLTEVFSTSVVQAIPYVLLIALVAVTSIVQQRQIQARNTGTAINPQQQAIMKIMPIFLPIFSIALPAGLVLYFVVSNSYRVGQQWFISRNIYGKAEQARGGSGDNEIKPYKSGSGTGGQAKETSADSGRSGLQGWLDRLTGRAEPEAEPEEEPKQVSRPAAKKKPAAKSGGRTTAKPAAKTATKTKPTGGSGAERNGRDRSAEAASKQKAGSRTSSASGSGSRATSTKRDSGSSESDSSASRPPLQPRARKNKKR